jgi:hypothetical protein
MLQLWLSFVAVSSHNCNITQIHAGGPASGRAVSAAASGGRVPLVRSRMQRGLPKGSARAAHQPTAISKGGCSTVPPVGLHAATAVGTSSTR